MVKNFMRIFVMVFLGFFWVIVYNNKVSHDVMVFQNHFVNNNCEQANVTFDIKKYMLKTNAESVCGEVITKKDVFVKLLMSNNAPKVKKFILSKHKNCTENGNLILCKSVDYFFMRDVVLKLY